MILQSVKMALKSIMSNKVRSFLTMLGIIIGVLSLVVLVSLVSDTSDSIASEISGMGTNLITVYVNDDKGRPLKMSDIEEIAEDPLVGEVAPVANGMTTCSTRNKSGDVQLYGTTGAFQKVKGIKLDYGRFIKNIDVTNHTNVIVINPGMALNLVGRLDCVGETVKLNGIRFEIIGVQAYDPHNTYSMEYYEAYLPYSSLIRLTADFTSDIREMNISAVSDDQLEAAESRINEILLGRFDNDEEAFYLYNETKFFEAMESINNTFAMLLGGIAAISLLVGGIGIMNIMLVSVTERTREIGIRKAIGAGRGTIMLQFLIEALVLSLVGCGIGIGLSYLAIFIFNQVSGLGYTYHVSLGVVWIAVLFALGIGLIFGIYPAWKASGKKPIDALHYTG